MSDLANSEYDIQIVPDHTGLKRHHRRLIIGHYIRLLTNPFYRAMWKEFKKHLGPDHRITLMRALK